MPCIPLFENNEGCHSDRKASDLQFQFEAHSRTTPFSEVVGRKEGDRDYPRKRQSTSMLTFSRRRYLRWSLNFTGG